MGRKLFKSRRAGGKSRTRYLFAVIAALWVAVVLTISIGYSKYVKQQDLSVNVTYTNQLANKFTLQEHKAVWNGTDNNPMDGTYTLLTEEEEIPAGGNNGNTYHLIPMIKIPKDPHITIEGKTDIPAYLYIEMVGAEKEGDNYYLKYYITDEDNNEIPITDTSVTRTVKFNIREEWKLLDGVKGPHGGLIFVYNNLDTPLGKEDFNNKEIYIIEGDNSNNDDFKNGVIYVGSEIPVPLSDKDKDGKPLIKVKSLDFYGYLLQQTDNKGAKDVFTANFKQTN